MVVGKEARERKACAYRLLELVVRVILVGLAERVGCTFFINILFIHGSIYLNLPLRYVQNTVEQWHDLMNRLSHAFLINNMLKPLRQNAIGGYHAGNQTPRYESMNDLERKPGFVALVQLHVDFFVWGDHLVLQIPFGAPTELCDDDVAVAEEVDVEVGVGTGLEAGEYS